MTCGFLHIKEKSFSNKAYCPVIYTLLQRIKGRLIKTDHFRGLFAGTESSKKTFKRDLELWAFFGSETKHSWKLNLYVEKHVAQLLSSTFPSFRQHRVKCDVIKLCLSKNMTQMFHFLKTAHHSTIWHLPLYHSLTFINWDDVDCYYSSDCYTSCTMPLEQ